MVREAKSMPLSSSVLLNREELLEMIGDMREALPEEIKQARWVGRDREELLLKARREAESIVAQARAEQSRMASQQAVARAAQEEAQRIAAEAGEQARLTRLEAEDYVDAKLAQFEITLQRLQESLGRTAEAQAESLERIHAALTRTAEQVVSGREKLRGLGHPARELAPEAEAEPVRADLLLESVVEGILVSGPISGRARLSCDRCLRPFEKGVGVEVQELFSRSAAPGGEEYLLSSQGEIDIEPMVRDAVLLSLPFSPLCRPGCLGLCERCGGGRNLRGCKCGAGPGGPRL